MSGKKELLFEWQSKEIHSLCDVDVSTLTEGDGGMYLSIPLSEGFAIHVTYEGTGGKLPGWSVISRAEMHTNGNVVIAEGVMDDFVRYVVLAAMKYHEDHVTKRQEAFYGVSDWEDAQAMAMADALLAMIESAPEKFEDEPFLGEFDTPQEQANNFLDWIQEKAGEVDVDGDDFSIIETLAGLPELIRDSEHSMTHLGEQLAKIAQGA